jgi:hypothetical protein
MNSVSYVLPKSQDSAEMCSPITANTLKENAMKVNVNDGELECHMLSARSAPRPSGVRALDKGIPYKLDTWIVDCR